MSPPVQVVLGPTYTPSMWDLRKQVSVARRSGEAVVFIRLSAPINSEVVEIAILSGSLYLIGVRGQDGVWREFRPDDERANAAQTAAPRARLPGSRWIMRGGSPALSSYRGLGLDWMLHKDGTAVFSNTPLEFVRFLRQWDGNLAAYDAQLHLSVLVLLICEALRFRTIENACARFIWPIGGVSPDPVERPSLMITRQMLDTVQNWDTRARAGDPDVWTWPPGMPDQIIT